jgi:hypothetical protein
MEFNVIVTNETDERLTDLLMQLDQSIPDHTPGVTVEATKREGFYRIIWKYGEQEINGWPTRIWNGSFIAKNATGILEGLLRRSKVPFREYEGIAIEDPRVEELNLSLPEEPQLIYKPKKE